MRQVRNDAAELEQILDQFENAWQSGTEPHLKDFLKPLPNRRTQLLELLHIDLEYRLKAGNSQRIEDYLSSFQELTGDDEAICGLLAAEFDLRRRVEPDLSLEEYASRFPGLFDRFRQLVEPATEFRGQKTATASSDGQLQETPADLFKQRAEPGQKAKLPEIAGYEVLELLGRGGMGIVVKARHLVLNRFEAIKIPLPHVLADPSDRERFLREARAAARLRHQHICPIHEVGETNGLPYIAMGYIEGETLQTLAQVHRPTARRAAEIVATIARAAGYAHEQGVIHRDIKPTNVTMDAAHDEPVLMDFGLAKELSDKSSLLSQSGQVIGTPSYMSPEQAAGELERVGPHSDVYSLGAVLYHLLCGRPPFEGPVSDVLRHVISEDPAPVRRWVPRIHRDLETICLKALAKNPSRRYRTADELAEDLDRFNAGEAILARPESRAGRLWRRARRSPVTTAAVIAVVLATASAAYFASSAIHSSRTAVELASINRSLDSEFGEIKDLARRLRSMDSLLGRLGELVPDQAGPRREAVYRRYSEFLRAAINRPRLRDDEVPEIQTALDTLTSLRSDFAQPLRQELAYRMQSWEPILDINQQNLADQLPLVFDLNDVKIDGSVLTRTTDPGLSYQSNEPQLQVTENDRLPAHLRQLVLTSETSHGNSQLEAVFDSRWSRVPEIGLVLNGRMGLTNAVRSIAVSRDGRVIATGCTDGVIMLWDATTAQNLGVLRGHEESVMGLAFSPDGETIASASEDKTIRLWKFRTGEEKSLLRGHTDAVVAAAFDPTGQLLASGGGDNQVKIWNAETGQEKHTLKGHTGDVSGVVFSPDGETLATSSADKSVILWDMSTGRTRYKLRGHSNWVWSLDISPDGKLVASAGADRSVIVWDASTGEQKHTLRGHSNYVLSVRFSPDGNTIGTAGGDNLVKLWDVKTASELRTFSGHRAGVWALAFSPNGSLLATASHDRTVRAWNVNTGSSLFEILEARQYGFLLTTTRSPAGPETPAADSNGNSYESAPKNGYAVTMRIIRDSGLLREQAIRIPSGPLRLLAQRDGDRLSLKVNDFAPIEFQEELPSGSAESGRFGLYWPPDVGLVSLQAAQRRLPTSPSLLEMGDADFAKGNINAALKFYEEQSRVEGTSTFGQEARCKQALCLLNLKRVDEATPMLERLAAESGDRWPIVAASKLWLIYLSHNRIDDADAIFHRLSAHYSFEQLASLIATGARENILHAYKDRGAYDVVKFHRSRVTELERAVAVERLFRVPRDAQAQTQLRLLRAYHAAEQWDRAKPLGDQLIRDRSFSHAMQLEILEDFVWLCLNIGDPTRAMIPLEERLFQRPGVYQEEFLALLVERARLRVALGEWDSAQKDIDDFLRLAPSNLRYEIQEASLLQGFLRDRAGDSDGAQESWRAGLNQMRDTHWDAELTGAILASLTGEITETDAARVISRVNATLADISPIAVMMANGAFPISFVTEVMNETWRTPRGHEYARRIAFRDISYREFFGIQMPLTVAAGSHIGSVPGELSAEHDKLIWDLSYDMYRQFAAGKIGEETYAAGVLAWMGQTGPFGWGKLAKDFEPSVRGPLTYVLGQRYFNKLHKRDLALSMFNAAKTDAAAGSLLDQLVTAAILKCSETSTVP